MVSSGAIAAGRRHLGLASRVLKVEEKQAAAATGQIRLAHAWQAALGRHDITVAQILLTPDDTEQRRRHLNARSTISQLLKLGAVPVINENDTVSTDEIRFGDNDRLAARAAPPRPGPPARACCPPGSPASTGRSSAVTRWWCADPPATRSRADWSPIRRPTRCASRAIKAVKSRRSSATVVATR